MGHRHRAVRRCPSCASARSRSRRTRCSAARRVMALYDPKPAQLLDAVKEHRPTAVMGFSHIHAEPQHCERRARRPRLGRALDLRRGRGPRAAYTGAPSTAAPSWSRRRSSTASARPTRWRSCCKTTTLGLKIKGRCIGQPTGAGEVAVLRRRDRGRRRRARTAGRGPNDHRRLWNNHDLDYRSSRRLLAVGRRRLPRRGRPLLPGRPCRRRDPHERGARLLGADGGGAARLWVAEICDCGVVAGVWAGASRWLSCARRRARGRRHPAGGGQRRAARRGPPPSWRCWRSRAAMTSTRPASPARSSSACCASASATSRATCAPPPADCAARPSGG